MINVLYWGKYHPIIDGLKLDKDQTINYIDTIWKVDTEYPDYFEVVILKFNDWYIEKLNSLGYLPLKPIGWPFWQSILEI